MNVRYKNVLSHVALCLLICTAHFSLGQNRRSDVIVKRDSVRVVCRILEINDRVVHYKKANDQEGPVFKVLKSDIARIAYGNGDLEAFPAKVATVDEKEGYTTNRYARVPWKRPGFMEELSGQRSADLRHARDFFRSKAKERHAMGLAFGSVGAAAAIAGAIIMANADDKGGYGYYGIDYEKRNGGKALVVVGLATGIGVGLMAGLNSHFYRRKLLLVEQELENRKLSMYHLKIRPSFDPFRKNASVSLVLHF